MNVPPVVLQATPSASGTGAKATSPPASIVFGPRLSTNEAVVTAEAACLPRVDAGFV